MIFLSVFFINTKETHLFKIVLLKKEKKKEYCLIFMPSSHKQIYIKSNTKIMLFCYYQTNLYIKYFSLRHNSLELKL